MPGFLPIIDIWSELARRCFVSHGFAKQTTQLLLYGGHVDPWLDAILLTELQNIYNATNVK